MGKSQTRLPSLDIMINKTGVKIWMDISNKPTSSKRYAPFMPNNAGHYLTNMTSSLARRIFNIFENEIVKEKRFKELKKTLLQQK